MIDPMDELVEHQIRTVLSDAQEVLGGLSLLFRGTAGAMESLLDTPPDIPLGTYNKDQFEVLKSGFSQAAKAFEAAEKNISILQGPEGIRLLKLVGPMYDLACSFLEVQITGEARGASEKTKEFLKSLDSEPDKPPGSGDLLPIAKRLEQRMNDHVKSGKEMKIEAGKTGDKNLLDMASGLQRVYAVVSRLPRLTPESS
jgi:hypothetical protein